jgi:hypothetical protein
VSGTNYFVIFVSNGAINFVGTSSGGGSVISSGANNWTVGTWNHFAVVRISGSVTVYLNGIAGTATANTTNFNDTTLIPTIGRYTHTGTNFFYGYISNLRYIKGTAVYTSAFTPPTTPLTPITNTSLLTCADNRLIDDSINNFTVTKFGDVSVQRFSPFSPSSITPTSYSGYFDGTGDYLTWSGTTVGTGAMTFECWFYYTGSFSGISSFIGPGSAIAGGLNCNLNNSTTFSFDRYGVAADNYTVSTISANTWNHVAFVRNSSNVATVFFNGVRSSTGTVSDTYSYTTSAAIGYTGGIVSRNWIGYISNARLVVGSNVYDPTSTTITVPTSPLTAITNTSLLTCQSPTFIDNSTNNFAITAVGNSRPTQQNPFGFTTATTNGYTSNTIGGSGYFDGVGDYLVTAANSALALATNAADFTIECWVYNNGYAGSQYGRGICIYYPSAGYGSNRLMFRLSNGANRINLYLLANGSAELGGSGSEGAATITPNAWTHVALVRNAGVFYVYVNGVIDITVNSSSAASSIPFTTFNMFEIGRTQDGTSPDWFGNISNYRFVRGTAVYTSNFVPPSQPVTAVTNTALLLNMTNAGIIDNAMMNNLETVGNAQISTTQSQFGGSSMYFDGTGDWLVTPISTSLGMGTGDFTIEGWFYATSPTYAQGFFHINATAIAGTNAGYAIGVTSAGVIQYYAGNTFTNTSSTITANTWTYLALVRSAGTVKVYVNGILPTSGSSIADSQNVTTALAYLALFYSTPGTSYAMTGYINDFRITKGYARYTANFTPPTTAFPIN